MSVQNMLGINGFIVIVLVMYCKELCMGHEPKESELFYTTRDENQLLSH